MGLIYIIRNDVNDKVYIGQTEQRSAQIRFSQHKNEALKGYSTAKLYVAIREIGVEHFFVENLLAGVDPLALDCMETYFIEKYDSYKNGYNSTIGGAIGHSGVMADGEILLDCPKEATYAINMAIVDAFFNNAL